MMICDCCNQPSEPIADFRHLDKGMLCLACTVGAFSGGCSHEDDADEMETTRAYLEYVRAAGDRNPQQRDALVASLATLSDMADDEYARVKDLLDQGWKPWEVFATIQTALSANVDGETMTGMVVTLLLKGAQEMQIREAMEGTEDL